VVANQWCNKKEKEVDLIFPHLAGRSRAAAGRLARALILPVVAVMVIPAPAAAYIDPVSGSILLQIISAAILAGAVTIGRARAWLLSLLRRATGQSNTDIE
jgi:hypothetical protein